jgi:hypothetical protein
MADTDLSAALDELAAARGDALAYLEASKKILAQVEKLREAPSGASGLSPVSYSKLLQEFIFSAKCSELRSPSSINHSAASGSSKY